MTISPVTPKDKEQLVPTTTAIIFDATESVTSVEVNNTIIWSGGAPQNGWFGYTVVHPAGTRYIFDPPSAFTVGDLKTVEVFGGVTTLVYAFVVGLRQITTTDDASSPRVVETGDKPWVVYPRLTGNIHVRKDEPLTVEVPVVPGDKVDVGYNEVSGEVEIMYIHNGKVFIVVGDDADVPSTLTQPSILKNDVKTGDVGSGENRSFVQTTFTPLKRAVVEPTMTTGNVGSGDNRSYTQPPSPPTPAVFNSSPVAVFIPPPSSSLITALQLYKLAYGGRILLAELTSIQDSQVYLDYAWARGDRYEIVAVYGDPGAPARRRFSDPSASRFADNGDVMLTGVVGSGDNRSFTQTTFTPLKRAIIEPTMTTGDVGSPADAMYYRNWYPSNGTAATMSTNVGEHIVVTGLNQMGRQHVGLNLTVSGAANAANNGSWSIVEIISSSAVRVRALTAPGTDANNGALTWTVTGPSQVSPSSFISRNTQNIGVG